MQKIKVYLSHCISDDGVLTEEIMQKNCQIAIDFADFLRKQFPILDIYVPAEHEDFVHRVYAEKVLTIEQILQIDCAVLSTKDVVIALTKNGALSEGMKKETTFAKSENIPVFYCEDGSPFLLIRMLEKFLFDRETLIRQIAEQKQVEETNGE
jgi:2-hydroxy-3-keto-5-methylthiopentenyl-1-phosphate phosphatase